MANRVSILRATFQQIDKRKVKYLKQLKIIETIKTSNLVIKEKVNSKEQKLKNLNNSYTSNTGTHVLCSAKVKLPLQQVFFDHNTLGTVGQDNSNDIDKKVLI